MALAAARHVRTHLAIGLAANWGLAILLAGMVAPFVGRFARNLHRLANLKPQRFRWWESGS